MSRKKAAVRKDTSFTEEQMFYQTHRKSGHHDNNVIQIPREKTQRKPVNLVPRSIAQENFIAALTNDAVDVVVVGGPAGTGKTYLAMLAAIQALRNKEISKIVITRPAVGVDDEKHGFLPGDLNQKMEPWVLPLLDVLKEHYSPKEVTSMVENGIVEIAPLAFCRGRTFKDSFIILDEAQNCTPSQVLMLLTRIGEGSKIVVTGDIEQTDRKVKDNGLMDLEQRLRKFGVKGIELVEFGTKDIQRHPIISGIIELYNR